MEAGYVTAVTEGGLPPPGGTNYGPPAVSTTGIEGVSSGGSVT